MDRDIEVKYIGAERGRGVFAKRRFRRGQIIERAPVVCVFDHVPALEKLGIDAYEFAWGHKKVAIVGGFTHFYNHSDTPNVVFDRDLRKGVITVRALRSIQTGDELCHTYACEPWFKPIKGRPNNAR